uniref:Transmembrane protein n=1 Tax=Mycena chlorophos TaxID=658473 RepID=A0ABQ0M6E9_MYCCL|nr:predicted protein [Mycena chlorophos]
MSSSTSQWTSSALAKYLRERVEEQHSCSDVSVGDRAWWEDTSAPSASHKERKTLGCSTEDIGSAAAAKRCMTRRLRFIQRLQLLDARTNISPQARLSAFCRCLDSVQRDEGKEKSHFLGSVSIEFSECSAQDPPQIGHPIFASKMRRPILGVPPANCDPNRKTLLEQAEAFQNTFLCFSKTSCRRSLSTGFPLSNEMFPRQRIKSRQSSPWSLVPPPLPPLHPQANMLSLTSALFVILVASAFALVLLLFVAASLPADVLGRLVSWVSQRRRLPILDEENAAPSVTVVPSFVVLSRQKVSMPVAVPKAQLDLVAERPKSAITRGHLFAPEVLPGRFPTTKAVARRTPSPLSNVTDEALNETITNTQLSASVSVTFPSYLFASSPSCESVSDLEAELPLPSKPLTQLVEAVRVPIILFAPRTQALETVVLDETRVIPKIILTPAPIVSEPSVPLSPAKPTVRRRERASSFRGEKHHTATVQRRGKENGRPASPPKTFGDGYLRACGRPKPSGPKARGQQHTGRVLSDMRQIPKI